MTTQPMRPLVRPGHIGGGDSLPRPAHRDPSGGIAARRWRDLVEESPRYPGVAVTAAVPITLSDGAVLRAYIFQPADSSGTAIAQPFPTVLNLTPYNKELITGVDTILRTPVVGSLIRKISASVDFTGSRFDGITEITRVVAGGAADLLSVNRHLVQSGYVQVIADVRGTGSSTGVWDVLGPREQLDSLEILEWIRAQSWCNGRIGMAGISYSAINSLQAAAKKPEGLDAIFAVEGSEDIVREIFATGGAPSLFIPLWLTAVNILKWFPSPEKLHLRKWILDRLRSPATNLPQLAAGFLSGADPRIYDTDFYDAIDADVSKISAATFLYGCWHDIFGGASPEIYSLLELEPGRKQLLVGDGYHANPGVGFGNPGFPPRLDVLERAWFDRWLGDVDNGIEHYGPVTLRQQGGGWTAHGRFPAPRAHATRLYLSVTRSSTATHAQADASMWSHPPDLAGKFSVRPTFRTAISRDTTQVLAGVTAILGGGFTYDNRFAERAALAFTTPPVDEPTVISGPMNLHLRTISHAPEAMWAIMLCDVAPSGRSIVLTNGALLASRRAVDDALSEMTPDGDYLRPHHPLTKAALLPVPIGEPITLDIDLLSTEAVLQQGHRLRVDIFAMDAPRFMPILPDLFRTRFRAQEVVIDPAEPSYLVLPVLGEPGW